MRWINQHRLYFYLSCIYLLSCLSLCYGMDAPQEFYQIKIYQFKTKDQETRIDQFLKIAFLPALHRAGIDKIGVFKPLSNDTAEIRRTYLLIPFSNINKMFQVNKILDDDKQYQLDGKDYFDAVYTDPPYSRIESILLQAFPDMPHFGIPDLKTSANERVYELRSYEGATEKIHDNKLKMFNEGGEIPLFKSLGFNAVFYAEVLSGSHMPNLMYMTSFDNLPSHDQHWKAFGDSPEWKKLSGDPIYKNNVSHIDIVLMHPTEYSDL
jgi:hypothetical protein